MKRLVLKSIGAAAVTVASFSALPAHALLVNGITYTLTMTTTADPLTNAFTLDITGINGAADDEGGRYGVESIAFNEPTNFLSAVAPAGYVYSDGGLNANGCNGSGNFFCFDGPAPNPPPLAAGSSLSLNFSLTLSAGSFAGYAPDFKINWEGTQNNYNLVSLVLPPTPPPPPPREVPEPMTLSLLGLGLLGLAFTRRQQKA